MSQEQIERIHGPQSTSIEGRRVRQVTQFTGDQLVEINQLAVVFQAEHPSFSGDLALVLGETEKQQKRYRNALPILNQLSLTGVELSTVAKVSVVEDPESVIEQGKTGEGGHREWYEIERDMSDDVSVRVQEAIHRAREHGIRVDIKSITKDVRSQVANEKARKLSVIDDLIMDNDRGVVETSLWYDHLRITLDSDGKAQIQLREGTVNPFKAVDRSTGNYESDSRYKISPFRKEQFRYVDFLARRMEGEEVTWEPKRLTFDEYLSTYRKAIAAGLLKIVQGEDGSIMYKYQAESRISDFANPHEYHDSKYEDIDFETGELDVSFKDSMFPIIYPPRHFNPHFLQFLKERKSQIEAGVI